MFLKPRVEALERKCIRLDNEIDASRRGWRKETDLLWEKIRVENEHLRGLLQALAKELGYELVDLPQRFPEGWQKLQPPKAD